MARITGKAHRWFDPRDHGFGRHSVVQGECCRDCGAMKARDPKYHDRPTCPGKVKVELRDTED